MASVNSKKVTLTKILMALGGLVFIVVLVNALLFRSEQRQLDWEDHHVDQSVSDVLRKQMKRHEKHSTCGRSAVDEVGGDNDVNAAFLDVVWEPQRCQLFAISPLLGGRSCQEGENNASTTCQFVHQNLQKVPDPSTLGQMRKLPCSQWRNGVFKRVVDEKRFVQFHHQQPTTLNGTKKVDKGTLMDQIAVKMNALKKLQLPPLHPDVVDAHYPQLHPSNTSSTTSASTNCRDPRIWGNIIIDGSIAFYEQETRRVLHKHCEVHGIPLRRECSQQEQSAENSKPSMIFSESFSPMEVLAVLRRSSSSKPAENAEVPTLLISGDSMMRQLFMRLVAFLRRKHVWNSSTTHHGGQSNRGDDDDIDEQLLIEHYFHCDAVYTITAEGDSLNLLYNARSPILQSERNLSRATGSNESNDRPAPLADNDDSSLLLSLKSFPSVKAYFQHYVSLWNASGQLFPHQNGPFVSTKPKTKKSSTLRNQVLFQIHFLWDPDQDRSRLLEPSFEGNHDVGSGSAPHDPHMNHWLSFGYHWVNGKATPVSNSIQSTFLKEFQRRMSSVVCGASSTKRCHHVVVVGVPSLEGVHNPRHVYNSALRARDDLLLQWAKLIDAKQQGKVDVKLLKGSNNDGNSALEMIESSSSGGGGGGATSTNKAKNASTAVNQFSSFGASFVDFNGLYKLMEQGLGLSTEAASLKLRCDGTHFMCSFIPRAPAVNRGATGLKTASVQDAVANGCNAAKCRDDVNFSLLQWLVQLHVSLQ